MKNSTKRNLIILVLFLLVVILTGVSLYLYFQSKKILGKEDANTKEINTIVTKVGKIAVLPMGETPTVATVSDPKSLAGQAFFVDAKQGDKVLMYSNAKKAYLYDPVQNKIINISTISIDANKKIQNPSN